jgi:hypothetical protein
VVWCDLAAGSRGVGLSPACGLCAGSAGDHCCCCCCVAWLLLHGLAEVLCLPCVACERAARQLLLLRGAGSACVTWCLCGLATCCSRMCVLDLRVLAHFGSALMASCVLPCAGNLEPCTLAGGCVLRWDPVAMFMILAIGRAGAEAGGLCIHVHVGNVH